MRDRGNKNMKTTSVGWFGAREGSVPNGNREKKEQQLWGELSRTPTLVSKKFSGSSILCSIVDMMTCATR